MSSNKDIEQLVNDALGSADGAQRATARPYLFTRLQANIQRHQENYWEKTSQLIARPVVAIAGLCLVLLINLAVVLNSNDKPVLQEELTAQEEGFSNSVAAVYDIDNNEP